MNKKVTGLICAFIFIYTQSTRSSKLPANVQQTSSKRPANIELARPL